MIDYNIIVLDFDGCLTSIESGTSFLLIDDLSYKPCKKLVDKVKKLCDETNSKIMIASNWRKYGPDDYYTYRGVRFTSQLPKLRRMLKGYLTEDLPYERHVHKADSLFKWLKEHEDFKGKFVIFDDADYEGYGEITNFGMNEKFIMVDCNVGITDENIEKARKILTE